MEEQAKQIAPRRLPPWGVATIIIGVTFILVVGITTFVALREYQNETSTLEALERDRVESVKKYIETSIRSIGADVEIAASHGDLKELVRSGDADSLRALEGEYLAMSASKGVYDQIRYLDETGQERARANYNKGEPYVVAEESLQNKKGRYYFDDAMALDDRTIFVSPFDLNIERGEIEQPIKPMIRFAKVVYNDSDEKKGIVLINYLGESLIGGMRDTHENADSNLLLMNKDGYWLVSDTPEHEWAFMYDDREDLTADNTHPSLWPVTQQKLSGTLKVKEGLYTFARVFPLDASQISSSGSGEAFAPSSEAVHSDAYSWTIVSFVPSENIATGTVALVGWLALIGLLLLIIVTLITIRLARSMRARALADKSVLELNDLLRIINKMLRHDVLGKLSGARASLELTELRDNDVGVGEAYEAITSGIELVQQMKQLEQSVTTGELKKYRLRALVDQVALESSMQYTMHGDAEAVADEALKSVLENLFRNAQRHGGVNTVDVQVSAAGKMVEVRVADEGKGIPVELHDKIFEESFKHGDSGNTGIGLYIVKKTIERYGGEIRVANNRPRGAVFIFTLPKA